MHASNDSSLTSPPQHSIPNYLLGTVLGLLLAFLGVFGWRALTAATNKRFDAAAVLIGILIGFAVQWGTKKRGIGPGVLGGVLTLGALLAAHYFIAFDRLTLMAKAQGYRGIAGLSFLESLKFLNAWAWVLVVIGVYCGFILPFRKTDR